MSTTEYAPVPPGCQYYNPRRQRRYDRKTRELFAMSVGRRQALDADIAKRREAVRERLEREKQQKNVGLLGKLSGFTRKLGGFTRKLFGRKTG